jgi:hypothetical protein
MYGLPNSLLDPIRDGVQLAVSKVHPDDGDHNGRSLYELCWEWERECRVSARHEERLTSADAASLLTVMELAIGYLAHNDYAKGDNIFDFSGDAAFALHSEEIVLTLKDIVHNAVLATA